MTVEALSIAGAFQFLPRVVGDDRGHFAEWYRHEDLTQAVGHPLELAQANVSLSRAGTVRGIHYADVPPGQAKYVTCLRGAVLDVVVDLRVGSPTFATWQAVLLDAATHNALYLPEGLGHAFYATTDDATVAYLCSTVYTPAAEHAIHPHDPDLAITWPRDTPHLLSPRDAAAPTLAEAVAAGALPTYAACRAEADAATAAASTAASSTADA